MTETQQGDQGASSEDQRSTLDLRPSIVDPRSWILEAAAEEQAQELECHLGAALPAARPEFPVCGEVFGDYRLLAELGRGAQGRVFLARQLSLADRPVVLKMTPCAGQEHLTLARLLHAHIAPLFAATEVPARNLRVLCLPWLGGASLARVLAEAAGRPPRDRCGRHLLEALDRLAAAGPLPLPGAGPARNLLARLSWADALCWLGACLADALQFAHERGLVHLDLKPSNVLLAAEGTPMLLDFHLARSPVTAGGAVPAWFGGTSGCMAPEQAAALAAVRQGRPVPAAVDGRADAFSLALILYESLGGPAEPDRHGRRPLLCRFNPQVSRGLADVLGRCLQPDPARRYRQAAELAADLRRHLAGAPLRGVPNRSLAERWRKWRRRRPHALTRAGGLLTLAAAAAALLATGLLHVADVRREADAALAEGRALLRQRQPAEAERRLQRGAALARRLPLATALRQELEQEERRAAVLHFTGELRRLADDLRFAQDPETVSQARAAWLSDRCAAAWQRAADEGVTAAVRDDAAGRDDLLDLAVLWAEIRLRAATDEEEAARAAAVRVLDEAGERFGPSPVLRRERARLLRQPGAEEPGDRAGPRSAWECYALGRSLLRAGRTDEAATAFAEAVRLQPNGFWPNFYDGVGARRQGRHEDAVAAFRACLTLAPDCAPCYHNRALSLADLDRRGAARRDLDRALELDPNLGVAWLARGVLSYREQRFDDALADLDRALEHGADPAAVHFDRALVHQARQDRAAALRDLDACLGLRPDHAAARELRRRLAAPR
jgi:serine/threonine protein kinase/Tfp pilus assembly protein PilF